MNHKPFYAHTLNNEPESSWQPLKEQLKNTANLAKQFAQNENLQHMRVE